MTLIMQSSQQRNYVYYKKAFEGEQYPLMYVDTSLLDWNIASVLSRAGDKLIRIASKSIRCTHIMSYILQQSDRIQGIMCYSAEEAVWLSNRGFDDLLVAYPCVNRRTIEKVVRTIATTGKKIYLTVDCIEHLQLINTVAHEVFGTIDAATVTGTITTEEKEEKAQNGGNVIVPVCIDVNMAVQFPLGIHFGVRRSPLSTAAQLGVLLDAMPTYPHIAVKGMLGYEAQIAGLGDERQGSTLLDWSIRQLKRISIPRVTARRRELLNVIKGRGIELDFVNGGGTGSLASTVTDACITEVAVGSAFYSPTLFDAYRDFSYQPACGFAIQAVRSPSRGVLTCFGGGYVGSGGISVWKAPQLHLPVGCVLDPQEMAGEVQTPVHLPVTHHNHNHNHLNYTTGSEGEEREGRKREEGVGIGDPILLRHSKAGELCERFAAVLLVTDGTVRERVPTYRGEGQCFG